MAASVFLRRLDAGPDAGALELSTELSELADVSKKLRISGVLARGEALEDLHCDSSVNEAQQCLESVDHARAQAPCAGHGECIPVADLRHSSEEPGAVLDQASTRCCLLEETRADRLECLPLQSRVLRVCPDPDEYNERHQPKLRSLLCSRSMAVGGGVRCIGFIERSKPADDDDRAAIFSF
ncbi:hypothetical protein NLM24_44790 [Nocardia zapadnayensis]|nr:hypothetical protein [Nocardia zapadnayensis]MCX0277578.1 hypothetical protein [Nocardia zapadnayensis]